MLTDDSPHPGHLPTRNNIINAMRWLVSGAHQSDSLFFHCMFLSLSLLKRKFHRQRTADSEHGGQTPDLNGDETDGCDEGSPRSILVVCLC